MANLNTVLNERIARVARREIRAMVGGTRKAATQHRRVLALLKRQVRSLGRRLAVMETIAAKTVRQAPAAPPGGTRFSARNVKSQRTRLGLSAANFAKLVGVSALTVYKWESGKSRPRARQMAKLVSVRGIGKREAATRLAMVG